LLTAAEEKANEQHLIVGDFNTGRHCIDEKGRTFSCADQFEALAASGWCDAWRHIHHDEREYTWFSRLSGGVQGNGFRLDHAFVTRPLLTRVQDCRYSHAEREAQVSDHSILILDIAPTPGT
jgi:exonuclease III